MERKKAATQEERYASAYDQASKKESMELTDQQIENLLYSARDKFMNEEGRIDAMLLRIIAHDEFGVKIGHNRAYRIKKALEY